VRRDGNQGGKPMYRNYNEYLIEHEKMVANAPEGMKIHKKSEEQFDHDNYRDKVEWYLMEEWNTDAFHNIFFAGCDMDDDSEEPTPEEERAYDLHHRVHNIIDKCYTKKMSVNQAASKVYNYLKKKEAI
jgi:hypothetical protein